MSVSSPPRGRRRGVGASRWGLLALLCATLGTPRLAAQEEFDQLVFTAGTTIQQQNRDWAYLLWQGSSAELLRHRQIAVYAKAGAAGSPGAYTRQAVVGLQVDPAVLKVLLLRSVSLGEDLVSLDQHLGDLFQLLMPAAPLATEEKLSIVIRGSLEEPGHFENLMLLSRLHPGVSLALGFAYAQPIEQTSTFELREFDPASQTDLTVIGRVTLASGQPTVLPAPGRPVAVPETDNRGQLKPESAKGHLNAKLRWATADDLRRLALLHYGFNVYRVNHGYAVHPSRRFDLNPPSLTALQAAVAAGEAVRVNRQPIITEHDFDPANEPNPTANPNDVANFDPSQGGDSTTYFVADDNGGWLTGGVPFQNGEQFYYFVTARDILGRDGLVSPGRLVLMCDRLPPLAPSGVRVENEYAYNNGVPTQHLRVWWRPDDGAKDNVTGYYVYRWLSPAEAQRPAANAANPPLSPLIPHVAGAEFLSFVDDGSGGAAPITLAEGVPYWYTVRALDDSACGGNLSPHSRPVFGVVRDREGPAGPVTWREVQCVEPQVSPAGNLSLAWPEPDADLAAYQIGCVRTGAGGEELEWADFYYALGSTTEPPPLEPTDFVARGYYPAAYTEGEFVNTELYLTRADLPARTVVYFFCQVGTRSGKISNLARVEAAQLPAADQFLAVAFGAELQNYRGRDCASHTPVPPGSSEKSGIQLCAQVTPTSKEYRFYRRVDYGPLTLIKQGSIGNELTICHTDVNLPASSGVLCYYAQLLDEQGNASPIVPVGDCIPVHGAGALPQPLLTAPEPAGLPGDPPRMKVQWFVPPAGIERFELHLAVEVGQVPQAVSDQLSDNLVTKAPWFTEDEPVSLDGVKTNKSFKVYLTPMAGPAFGDGAQFSVEVAVEPNRVYTVMVRARDYAGGASPFSIGQSFVWGPPQSATPLVPWPARSLPTAAPWHPELQALVMPTNIFRGLGVRIGFVPFKRVEDYEYRMLPPNRVPLDYLYPGPKKEALLPVAMYRYQTPNALYPQVSGDLVQVSPLMEEIAHELVFDPDLGDRARLHDPFIGINQPPQPGTLTLPFTGVGLYLLDTQPVIRGARYAYLLVRFDPQTREMVQVIPTNEVEANP